VHASGKRKNAFSVPGSNKRVTGMSRECGDGHADICVRQAFEDCALSEQFG
jgi:hypothetical protein